MRRHHCLTGKIPMSVWGGIASALLLVPGLGAAEEEVRLDLDCEDGKVRLSWEPDLNAKAPTRIYTLYGRRDLGEGEWESPIRPWHRFFKVEMREPTGAPGEVSSMSGVTFEPCDPPAPGEKPAATHPAMFVEPRVEVNPEPVREYGYVQLWEGGPYWAECNLGASRPEESGDYFRWGDTIGYRQVNERWVSSNGAQTNACFNAQTCGSYDLTAENRLIATGFVGSDRTLVASRDAATSSLGAGCRLPTEAEFAALLENCDATWASERGVEGLRVTGRGEFSARSIFLPAAGCATDYDLVEAGANGYYWTSQTPVSSYTANACYLRYYSSESPRVATRDRYRGQSIRPVRMTAE